MSLRSVEPLPTYRKYERSLANEFYGPCLLEATLYRRAVGFFSSSIYVIAWRALRVFVARGGRMQLICSPFLSPQDASAMSSGYEARARVEHDLTELVDRWLRDPATRKPAQVLGALISHGVLDVKIATVIPPDNGMQRILFHDKLGIFEETATNDFIVFKGSMNETHSGLSDQGNLESIDVSVSWDSGRDGQRAQHERDTFSRLWEGTFPGVVIEDFPSVPKERLVQAAADEDWEELVERIIHDEETTDIGGRSPFPHQVNAFTRWVAAGRRGILEHATGSGKTVTAMLAVREALQENIGVLVLVPSSLLLEQWRRELTEAFPSARLLVAGDGAAAWRRPGMLEAALRASKPSIVLSTMQTACTSAFLARLHRFLDILVVADEVHRLGSESHASIIRNWAPLRRLGLSATPARHGDPDGTQNLLDWFGPVVDHYGIEDAIRDGRLTRYWYAPHVVQLAAEEEKDYRGLGQEIAQVWARIHQGNVPADSPLRKRMNTLLLERARIIKQAAGKITAAAEILEKEFRPGERWLVYCDSLTQLRALRRQLQNSGLPVDEYYSDMPGDPEQTIRFLASSGGILLSIRCLDEGVDIPAVGHALILASSQNPREYIQRRGRVLRRHAGKHIAYVHDVLVVPPVPDPSDPLTFIEAEVKRSIEFGRFAVNPGCVAEVEALARQFGALDAIPPDLNGVEP